MLDNAMKHFESVTRSYAVDKEELLRQLGSMLDKGNDKQLAKNFKVYMDNRSNYIEKFNGKYVQISSKGIHITDIKILEDKDTGSSSKYEGLLLKVGNEMERNTKTLLSWSYNPPTDQATMVIDVDNNGTPMHTASVNMLLDTGCQVTTLGKEVLDWIRDIDPRYATASGYTTGIGGTVAMQSGLIRVNFCGKGHVIFVNYVDLVDVPFAGLIGMDIINSGILSLDTGTRGSFTHH